MRSVINVAALIAVLCLASHANASAVSGYITADNHYALYTGGATGLSVDFRGANESGVRGAPGRYNWSEAEYYNFTTDDEYIYVAAWSDDSVAQGLLADLTVNDAQLLSGDPAWEVYATGDNLNDGDPAPTVAEIAAEIANANAAGWEPITVGGTNGVAPWRTISNISLSAAWMWGPANAGSVISPGSGAGEYLLFRTDTPEPGSVVLLLGGAVATLLTRRYFG